MHTQTCGLYTSGDDNYFDITHSFTVGSSMYHVLGLRKDRPTYGNNYYIFNCTSEKSASARSGSQCLPFINTRRASEERSSRSARTRTTEIIRETGWKNDQTRPRTALQKKMESDTTTIKKTLVEIMKSEHETLVTSIRKEMTADKQTLLQSIEKEKDVFLEAISTANTEKQVIVRLLAEHKTSFQHTFEKHASSIHSSIELLKKTILEAINAQHDRLKALDQFQLSLIETITKEIEKTHKSTSIDMNTIDKFQSTLLETFDKRLTTKSNDDGNALKQSFAEQQPYLTDLFTKQQQTFSLEFNSIQKSQSTLLETINKLSSAKSENNHNDALKQLFAEQRIYLSEQMTKQHVDLIRETVLVAMKEQTTIADQCPFKVSIQTAEFAQIFAHLCVDGKEYPKELHTLCQRDPSQSDIVNCFVVPPLKSGALELTIYAMTNNETEYRAAISIQMPSGNITQGITFPRLHQSFQDHQCILIEPLRRFIQMNEQLLIHIILPNSHKVTIHNGDDVIVLGKDQFPNGILKTKLQVRGDLIVFGQWDGQTDSMVCAFELDNKKSIDY